MQRGCVVMVMGVIRCVNFVKLVLEMCFLRHLDL